MDSDLLNFDIVAPLTRSEYVKKVALETRSTFIDEINKLIKCQHCNKWKSFESFFKKSTSKIGREYICIECKYVYRNTHRSERRIDALKEIAKFNKHAFSCFIGRCTVPNNIVLQLHHKDGNGAYERNMGYDLEKLYVDIVLHTVKLDNFEVRCPNHNMFVELELYKEAEKHHTSDLRKEAVLSICKAKNNLVECEDCRNTILDLLTVEHPLLNGKYERGKLGSNWQTYKRIVNDVEYALKHDVICHTCQRGRLYFDIKTWKEMCLQLITNG